MIDYPDIPLPSTNFGDRIEVTTLRTGMKTGLIRKRPRFATGLRTVRVTWVLTLAELATFEDWHANDLSGGVLVFEIPWDVAPDRAYRFTEGRYDIRKDHAKATVTANLEVLETKDANASTVLPVPAWKRLVIDPTTGQQLTLSHRNALLTVRPDAGDTTTLRVFNPTSPDYYIYFGIKNLGDGDTLITSVDADPPVVLPAASWPTSLPLPLSGFGEDTERPVARLEMDSGHTRQVQRFDASVKSYSVAWDMDETQVQTFETFYHTTLRSGARQFTITLPVDGVYLAVPCRFEAGYATQYRDINRFRVTATLDRVLAQSETPSTWTPYGLYYRPVENVSVNTLVQSDDAGKFYIVYAASGQTVSLHIGSNEIEFGILLTGPGSVRITREPFVHTLPGDGAGGIIMPPALELESVVVDLGGLPEEDGAGSSLLPPVLELESVVVDIGESLENDLASSSINVPTFIIDEVLADVGALAGDNAGSNIEKPSLTLDIP